MDLKTYFEYLLVMAGVTYLLRTVPFILLKGELESRFWKSFLNYVPYTVLSAMTVPAIFYATDSRLAGVAALITAVIAGFLTSFLGGSRVNIGGPTGAFVAIVAGIVGSYGLFGRGLVVVAIVACLTVLGVDGAALLF